MFILNPWNLDQACHLERKLAKGLLDRPKKMHPIMCFLASWQISLSVDLLVYENSTTLMKFKHITE